MFSTTFPVILIFTSAVLPSFIAEDNTTAEFKQVWKEFKIQFNKTYQNQEEENCRMTIFKENVKKINEHNALYKMGKSTYRMKLNMFGDQVPMELYTSINVCRVPADGLSEDEGKKLLIKKRMAEENSAVAAQWEEFKVKHKKNYASEDEEKVRYETFKENKKKIDEHNAKYDKGEVSWKMGLNEFSDMKPDEFKQRMGLRRPEPKSE